MGTGTPSTNFRTSHKDWMGIERWDDNGAAVDNSNLGQIGQAIDKAQVDKLNPNSAKYLPSNLVQNVDPGTKVADEDKYTNVTASQNAQQAQLNAARASLAGSNTVGSDPSDMMANLRKARVNAIWNKVV